MASTLSGHQAPRAPRKDWVHRRGPAPSLSMPTPQQSLGHRKQHGPLPQPQAVLRGGPSAPSWLSTLPGHPSALRIKAQLLCCQHPPSRPGLCCLASLAPHGPSSILEAVLTPGLRFPHLIEFFSANFAHVAAWFWKALPPQPGALMPEAKSLATGHQRSWEKPEGPAGPASGWEGVLSLPSPLPGVRGLRLLVDNLHVTRRAQLSC